MVSQAIVASALLSLTLGAPLSGNGVVTVPLHKALGSIPTRKLPGSNDAKRSVPDQGIEFTGFRYFANYTIGGQAVSSILDTGSSDTFVFTNQSYPGGWVPGKSPDYHWKNDDFAAAFGDGSNQIFGSWATDSIIVGGAEIEDYPIGLLNQTYADFPNNKGILGIGPKAAETARPQYATIYDRLQSAGVINSKSFSLYNDGVSSSDAVLLLGGLDAAKYYGPLYTVPFALKEAATGDIFFTIDWQYKGVWYEGGVLDTGTPNILIPGDEIDPLVNTYNLTWNDNWGYVANGTIPDNLPPLNITVGGVNITVPPFSPADDVQLFAFQPSGGGLNTLGDPFLSAVYSVYDIDNETYSFAPVKASSESNIIPIGASVPGAQPAPNPAQNHQN